MIGDVSVAVFPKDSAIQLKDEDGLVTLIRELRDGKLNLNMVTLNNSFAIFSGKYCDLHVRVREDS